MKQASLVILATLVILTSCKKDTVILQQRSAPAGVASSSYLPLTTGNYWIYEMFSVDAAGTELALNKTDSIYIKKDTLINGKMCYYFCQSDTSTLAQGLFPVLGWVYDSTGFIIQSGLPPGNGAHRIVFDPVHLNDTISADTATWNVVSFVVPTPFSSCIVPAGTYSGILMDTRIRYLAPAPHSSPYSPTWTDYVADVGICYSKGGFVAEPRSGYSWKLLRYHI